MFPLALLVQRAGTSVSHCRTTRAAKFLGRWVLTHREGITHLCLLIICKKDVETWPRTITNLMFCILWLLLLLYCPHSVIALIISLSWISRNNCLLWSYELPLQNHADLVSILQVIIHLSHLLFINVYSGNLFFFLSFFFLVLETFVEIESLVKGKFVKWMWFQWSMVDFALCHP